VLGEVLLRRVHELAPGVCLEMWPIASDILQADRWLLQHDVLIAPLGFRAAGQPEVISRDRFVLIADPGNPRLRDGQLTMEDLRQLPHAAARLPHAEMDPVGRTLSEQGITPDIRTITAGWLPLPFVVAGTDMIAAIPERLARRVARAAGVTIAEPPFGRVELIEAAWWHPMRTTDPALTWLRTILTEVVSALAASAS
jgi:DNA-binding transcriptional LysR family regulator